MRKKKLEFEVPLSFAGEERSHAEVLAKILRDRGVKVFYDEFHKVSLWAKDLYQHLQTVYRDKAGSVSVDCGGHLTVEPLHIFSSVHLDAEPPHGRSAPFR
jgi:hypothetical protein